MQISDRNDGRLSSAPNDTSLLAAAVAGVAGGLVGSWLMIEFQKRVWPAPAGDKASSTAKMARRANATCETKPLSGREPKMAGELIHYALGAGLGLTYGVAARYDPAVTAGFGTATGMATEVILDQTAVPALGLARPFWKCPATWSLRGVVAHLIFGVSMEASRRAALMLPLLSSARRSRHEKSAQHFVRRF